MTQFIIFDSIYRQQLDRPTYLTIFTQHRYPQSMKFNEQQEQKEEVELNPKGFKIRVSSRTRSSRKPKLVDNIITFKQSRYHSVLYPLTKNYKSNLESEIHLECRTSTLEAFTKTSSQQNRRGQRMKEPTNVGRIRKRNFGIRDN